MITAKKDFGKAAIFEHGKDGFWKSGRILSMAKMDFGKAAVYERGRDVFRILKKRG